MKVTPTRRGGGGIASSFIMFGLVYRDKDKDNYKGNDREKKTNMCDTGLATGEWRLSISSPSIYLDCCTNAHDGGGVQQSPLPLSLQLVSHSSNLTMDISLGPIHNLRRGSFYDEAMLFGS